ncbi:endonuclease VII domain-containing protein [Micromonospora sp. KC723]|uniref:endonuclease VII domain-containing protein n=1 Tax=Micromonospora sp. KC723 TaxID=2530381 RepID=UPI00104D9820|nr:endonuclease VII domain-containing protein [Micromonospora sp. KC723]TDB77153.1 recombinase [Micromonospora sp. KC723]
MRHLSDAPPASDGPCPRGRRILPPADLRRNRRTADGLAFLPDVCGPARRGGWAQARHRTATEVTDAREHDLRRRYGVGEKKLRSLLAERPARHLRGLDPQHLDHDHRTGWVRGILCFNCNGGLGQLRDSPTRLARAITYLRGTTWQRVLIHPGVYQMCSPTRGRPPSPRS